MKPSFRPLACILVSVLVSIATVRAQVWEDITVNLPVAPKVGTGQSIASTGEALYVLATPNGVSRSIDNGATWSTYNTVGGVAYDLSQYGSRSIDAINGALWAGVEPGSGALTNGVLPLYRTTPPAAWTPSFSGATIPAVVDAVAFDSSTNTHWAAGRLGGIFKSTDGGNTWAAANGNLPGTNCASIVARNGTVIAAILGNGMGAFTSTDGGVTWTNNGVPLDSIGFLTSVGDEVCVIGQGATTLIDGIYFSKDFGLTWQFTQADTANGLKLLTNTTSDATTMFSGGTELILSPFTYVPKAAFSLNGGATWDDIPASGIPTGNSNGINRLARHGNYLFALTGANKLYRLDLTTVTLTPTLKIAVHPKIDKRITGGTLTMKVFAGGPGTLTYQWKKGGVDVPGQTSAALSIANAQPSDTGNYTCVVTAGGNSVTSNAARGTVVDRVDGRYDPTYDRANMGGGDTGTPFLQSNGSLIVGTSGGVYKLGPDGGKTDSRAIGGTTGYNGRLVDSSGRILLGGIQGNASTHRVRRLLGTAGFPDDTSFTQRSANAAIRGIAELPGSGYLIWGDFSTFGPAGGTQVSVARVVLIGYDGALNTTFNTNLTALIGAGVSATPYVAEDGTVWLNVAAGFRKINSSGQAVAGFTPYLPTLSSDFVSSAYLLKSGKMLVTLANIGTSRPLKLFNADGTFDTTFNTANLVLNNVFTAGTEQADGKIIIAGIFTTFGSNSAAGRYLRLDANGVFDSTFYNTTGFSTAGASGLVYDPRGYIFLANAANNASSGTFQDSSTIGDTIGQNFVRIFATAAPASGVSFATWKGGFSFPVGTDGLLDDPDGDGLSNLAEYAFFTDPLGGAAGQAPESGALVTIGPDQYPTIVFTRNKNAQNITITVPASATLPFGANLGTTLVSTVDLGNGAEEVTYRSNASIATTPTQFLRVIVSTP